MYSGVCLCLFVSEFHFMKRLQYTACFLTFSNSLNGPL